MRVTKVFLKKIPPATPHARVVARGSFDLDGCFSVNCAVVRAESGLIVAMPSRRLTDRCPNCNAPTPVTGRFCGWCGVRLADGRAIVGADGTSRRDADVAFPTVQWLRRRIHDAVLAEYAKVAGGDG